MPGHSTAMRLIPVVVVGALVSACSSSGPAPDPAATLPDQGKWFCQMEPSGDGWDCVQDPRLAEHPEPTRLPEARPQPSPVPPPEPDVVPGDGPLPLEPAGPLEPEDGPPEPDGPSPPEPGPGPQPAAAAAAPAGPADSDLPEYARLAYQPPQPVPLTDLPADYYAVQLIAMSDKAGLESFVERQGIRSMSAARVERDGELYFVLLLGIYETRDIARQAIDAMPEVHGAEPWIRPLGSLQRAMRRADAIAGSSRY